MYNPHPPKKIVLAQSVMRREWLFTRRIFCVPPTRQSAPVVFTWSISDGRTAHTSYYKYLHWDFILEFNATKSWHKVLIGRLKLFYLFFC